MSDIRRRDFPHQLQGVQSPGSSADGSRRACSGIREKRREALAIQVRVLAPEAPDTLWGKSNLARILTREGHYAEGEGLARAAYETEVRTLGPQHDQTVDTLRDLGEAMAYEHRYPEAAALFRDAMQQQDRPGASGNRWQNWYAFACVATAANRADDAMEDLRNAVNRGYSDADGLMGEDDLKSLRQNPRFQELVAALRRTPKPVQSRPWNNPIRAEEARAGPMAVIARSQGGKSIPVRRPKRTV